MSILNIFNKKKKGDSVDAQIKSITLSFDYGSEHIWCRNAEGVLLFWNHSAVPIDWQEDDDFMRILGDLSNQYKDLFVNNKKEFSYIGFQSEEQKRQMKNTIEKFVEAVRKKSEGKYEVVNDLNIDL